MDLFRRLLQWEAAEVLVYEAIAFSAELEERADGLAELVVLGKPAFHGITEIAPEQREEAVGVVSFPLKPRMVLAADRLVAHQCRDQQVALRRVVDERSHGLGHAPFEIARGGEHE